MEIIKGGVTAASGFKAAGAYAGFKKLKDNQFKEEINDMAMVVSDKPCNIAGTFTTNVVKAAPVQWDMDVVYNNKVAKAVVVNSGIANAATGAEGMKACDDTAKIVADAFGIDKKEVLIGSTGVIGYEIPMEKIDKGVGLLKEKLSDTIEAGTIASKAIMTTDTVNKEVAVKVIIDGKEVTIGGMCKGSGMIHPNMCTMLCYITTDANITSEMLQKALSSVVPDTFNMVSVDGDTSTNDTVLLLANGEAGNKAIDSENDDYKTFAEALLYVCTEFSKKMAGDGEGATALFEVTVKGAKSKDEAKVLAKSVVSSSLVKAMIYGHDANSGRILCALGYSGVKFDPEKVDLFFESKVGKIQIAKDGKVL
ncbi:MAG TPA: ornithine acetyltransferase, partial [Eubacterium sp.]|nr:ornithine acetyltransferase [Eubacterium sp.]